VKVTPTRSTSVALHYDLAAASNDDTKSVGGFDSAGNALPAELLPQTLAFNGVQFQLAPAATGTPDAVVARGQSIALPAGTFNRLYIVAASVDGDQSAAFKTGSRSDILTIQDWGGFVGQWDTREWNPPPDSVAAGRGFPGGSAPRQVPLRKDWAVSANHATWDLADRGSPNWSPRYPEDYKGLRPGYIKPADIAWFATHHHTPAGLNQPYEYSYLFVYSLALPAGTRSITLPDNDRIRVLAISASQEQPALTPVQPLYDTLRPQ